MLYLFVLTQSTNVTDIQTAHRPRLCTASRGKNRTHARSIDISKSDLRPIYINKPVPVSVAACEIFSVKQWCDLEKKG